MIWTIAVLVLGGALFGMIKLASYQSAVVVKAVTPDDWIQGDIQAPAVLVEYSDFQCPACAAYYPLTKRLQKELGPDKFLFVYRNFPLYQIHATARLAAQAAEAAGKQKKFWPYVSKIVAEKKYRSLSDLTKAAGDLQLVTSVFETCLNDPATAQKINESRIVAKQLGIQKAPVIFVNNRRITLTKDIELPQLLQAFIAP
jgi:protein-disulfide isomerase